MSLDLFIGFLYGVLGLFMGSFYNVVSDRLHDKKSFLFTRSKCEKCSHTLGFFDLIPVLSFIFLKGKCRYCRHKISPIYPLSEILTGILFFYAYLLFIINNLNEYFFAYYLIGFSLFAIIILSDVKYFEIPFEIVFVGFIFSLLYRFFVLRNLNYENFVAEIFSLIFIFIFFLVIILISKGGMGGGDLKLSLFISMFLGYPLNVASLYYGFLIGGLFAIILLLFGKKKLKSKIPLGPFLILGALIAMYFPTLLFDLLI
jgi:prepilin signal peptidase PulO-like enzyme (type II secretory pathway)